MRLGTRITIEVFVAPDAEDPMPPGSVRPGPAPEQAARLALSATAVQTRNDGFTPHARTRAVQETSILA